jgi:hypothetical protein
MSSLIVSMFKSMSRDRASAMVEFASARAGDICEFRNEHDADGEPVGPACGAVAVEVIFWNDGRYSPACKDHGNGALDDIGRANVVAVHPIR